MEVPARLLELVREFGVVEMASEALQKWAPAALKLIAVVIVGYVLSRVARRTVRYLGERFELARGLERLGLSEQLAQVGVHDPVELFARAAFMIGIFGTLYLGAEISGVQAMMALIGAIIAYIPTLLTSLGILAVGLVGATFARDFLSRALASKSAELARVLPTGLYFLIMGLVGMMSAEQLGINVELIQAVALITMGASALAIGGAFALGASPLLAQLVARYHVRRTYALGDALEVDGVTGQLVRFGPTIALLETSSGRAIVPYERLVHSPVARVATHTTDHETESARTPHAAEEE